MTTRTTTTLLVLLFTAACGQKPMLGTAERTTAEIGPDFSGSFTHGNGAEVQPAATPPGTTEFGFGWLDSETPVQIGGPSEPYALHTDRPSAQPAVAAAPSSPQLDEPPRQAGQPQSQPANANQMSLTVDTCGESQFIAAQWLLSPSTHFDIHYLPGTAAQTDLSAIIVAREAAYQDIRAALGVTAEPTINVYLSPDRVTAAAHGLGKGRALPATNRLEVIYTGAPDGYETVRYGHELTHLLAAQIDPAKQNSLPIFDEGLAEYLDQSNRDLHAAYAQQLIAGTETRTHVASFDYWDAWGSNYGRAGSLVQFLIESHGMAAFLDIWKQASWDQGWCHPTYGCVSDADELTQFLDDVLTDTIGIGWAATSSAWSTVVSEVLDQPPAQIGAAAYEEVAHLITVMDAAINTDDATLYRTTMEGFYCDWGAEDYRTDIAERTVSAYGSVTSQILAIYPTGIKNFQTASVAMLRTEATGGVSLHDVLVEHFPQGWKVTWGPDWY